ncbi:helix-turn-helix transcriptional regulator [Streptomyces sp. NPDC060198]|uniref:helix-turn-helix transcriptional regulator n=1 Tax=Streptomyces sp. NPDC060198 TaxID=3347070 RepID=UPI003647BA3D
MTETPLGAFLRARRRGLKPAELGLSPGARRRTPGLRREEVAGRAGISADYYARLEQGRQSDPTESVLDGLATALLLTDAERGYLHRLAAPRGHRSPPRTAAVSESTRTLLAAFTDSPALVLGPCFDLLAWNPLGGALLNGPGNRLPHERNLLWQVFCCPYGDRLPGNRAPGISVGADLVAALRAHHADHPTDPDLARLVAGLSASSAAFGALWSEHRASAVREGTLHIPHPALAPDAPFGYTVLSLPDPGQHLFVFLPPARTGGGKAFRGLADAMDVDAGAAAPERSAARVRAVSPRTASASSPCRPWSPAVRT